MNCWENKKHNNKQNKTMAKLIKTYSKSKSVKLIKPTESREELLQKQIDKLNKENSDLADAVQSLEERLIKSEEENVMLHNSLVEIRDEADETLDETDSCDCDCGCGDEDDEDDSDEDESDESDTPLGVGLPTMTGAVGVASVEINGNQFPIVVHETDTVEGVRAYFANLPADKRSEMEGWANRWGITLLDVENSTVEAVRALNSVKSGNVVEVRKI